MKGTGINLGYGYGGLGYGLTRHSLTCPALPCPALLVEPLLFHQPSVQSSHSILYLNLQWIWRRTASRVWDLVFWERIIPLLRLLRTFGLRTRLSPPPPPAAANLLHLSSHESAAWLAALLVMSRTTAQWDRGQNQAEGGLARRAPGYVPNHCSVGPRPESLSPRSWLCPEPPLSGTATRIRRRVTWLVALLVMSGTTAQWDRGQNQAEELIFIFLKFGIAKPLRPTNIIHTIRIWKQFLKSLVICACTDNILTGLDTKIDGLH